MTDPNQKGGNNPANPANSSVPLPGGGDTHIHPHKDGNTVTTRMPGGATVHDNFDKGGNYRDGGFD